MRRWIARNIFFRAQEACKRHRTFEMLREMEASERLSPAAFAEVCDAKLRDLIGYAYGHVGFIRARMQSLGLQPEDFRTSADISKLPVMTKGDVRSNRSALQSDIAGRLAHFSSGGSTGEPLIFDIAKRRVASRVACRQRVSGWWAVSVGDPELAIWGSPLELTRQDRLRGLRDWLLRTRLLSAYELTEDSMDRYIDLIATGRWRQIFAYPSAIYRLCLHARKLGRNLRTSNIKVVFVTSEVLYAYQRELITAVFGCPVANGYGGRDSGFIAHECPQGGMHVMADAVIAEIVDTAGRPLPPGETGEIAVTDLYSHEAPFIRYLTGDIGAISSKPCSCGRALPLLERLDGRSNDAIVAPDGRVMHGQALIGLLMETEGVLQYRIRQRQLDRFHVQLVCDDRYSRESEQRLVTLWSSRLRAPLHVTFEYVVDIATERSGKFRHIVSELPAGQLLQSQDEALVRDPE
jgi:phenylacetate-CoA ligase